MSVHDETWDRDICSFCKQKIQYATRFEHGEGKCINRVKNLGDKAVGSGITIGKLTPIREFETGAIRDSEAEKEDYVETISWTAFRRYAQYMTSKKNKYGAGNFKKGIPIESYERSLSRHLSKYFINKYENGDLEVGEDHISAILFNAFGIIHEEEMRKRNRKEIPTGVLPKE